MGRRAATARCSRPRPATRTASGTIGAPDAVFAIPPFEVPPEGTVDYTYFEVPTNLTKDKWVTAVQMRPSAPAAVHHVIVTARAERTPEEQQARRRVDPGFRLDYDILPGRKIEWNPGVAQLEGGGRATPSAGTTVGIDGVSLFQPGTARLLPVPRRDRGATRFRSASFPHASASNGGPARILGIHDDPRTPRNFA